MWLNLAAGTVLISCTILFHVCGLLAVSRLTLSAQPARLGRFRRVLLLLGAIFGLFVTVGVEIWAWAFAYLLLDVTPDFETALYLSTATFSTVGYGDVVPSPPWRLLAALEGITGFLVIGWSTAYLVTASTRLGPFRTGDHF